MMIDYFSSSSSSVEGFFFLFVSTIAFILAWMNESPPNLDEPRVKIMPGFPRDGDLPKPIARMLPPFVVTLPILYYHVVVIIFQQEVTPSSDNNNATSDHKNYYHYDYHQNLNQNQTIGFVLILLSHILMKRVQQHCGRFYTFDRSIKKRHTLITTGPYQYVQNPGYFSMILTTTGVLLFTNFIFMNILPVIIISIVLCGIPIEEQMLREEFGKSYDEYQATTKYRLIPGIF